MAAVSLPAFHFKKPMITHDNQRRFGIDLLRGVGILYIVAFWHLLNYTRAIPGYANIVTYRITYVILGTFVFISGYMIGVKGIDATPAGLFGFYRKKILRIYPLYLLAIGWFLVYRLSDPLTALKAACLISMLAPPAIPTLWFAAMLMMFFLVAPLLVAASRPRPVLTLAFSFGPAGAWLLPGAPLAGSLDLRAALYFPCFVLGILTATGSSRPTLRSPYAAGSIAVAMAAVVALAAAPHEALAGLLDLPLVAAGSLALFTVFSRITVSSRGVAEKISRLSYASYCMYLFHRPIYTLLRKLFFPKSHGLQLLYLVVVCLPCIACAAYFIQKRYDAACIALAGKAGRRGRLRPVASSREGPANAPTMIHGGRIWG
jgi:peptidoglycan/LPS O-acetylase OafA/YrhL